MSINYLDVAMGSQSLLNVDAVIAAGNTVWYLPLSSKLPPSRLVSTSPSPRRPRSPPGRGGQWMEAHFRIAERVCETWWLAITS